MLIVCVMLCSDHGLLLFIELLCFVYRAGDHLGNLKGVGVTMVLKLCAQIKDE